MPERGFDSLRAEDWRMVKDYQPGYDWIPGRFGPPPGIPKSRKQQLGKWVTYVISSVQIGPLC